jgi:DNA-binding LacI/PurR family transcriptional regulator
MRLLEGLAQATETAGLAVLLVPTPPDHRVADAVSRAAVDAFCIYAMPVGHPAVEAVVARGLPTVCIDLPVLEGLPFIGIDDRAAGRSAVAHLVERGHRRIGVITFRLQLDDYEGAVDRARLEAATFHSARDRVLGALDAVTELLGDDGLVEVVEAGATGEASGARAAASLMAGPEPPTAIFAAADRLAVGVLRHAETVGLAVPDDLAVVGFDDLPIAAQHDLTSVRQPAREKGHTAGTWLVEGVPQAAHLILPTHLVVRGSTGG